MNLLQMRTLFLRLSGRTDLVNQDFTDNGANFYLNEGRKFLDRLDETQKSWASMYRFVEIGGFTAVFPFCRAIKEVWASTTTARWQLEKKNLQDMIAGYLAGTPSSRSVGTPLFYSPIITRYIPEDAIVTDIEAFVGFVEIPSGNASAFNGIILNVPVSEKTGLDIRGLFYSMELTEDTDENYWSAVHPQLLYMAAMRYAEINNRNTQGKQDWERSILDDMKQLGMDLVEEIISEVTQIKG